MCNSIYYYCFHENMKEKCMFCLGDVCLDCNQSKSMYPVCSLCIGKVKSYCLECTLPLKCNKETCNGCNKMTYTSIMTIFKIFYK